MSTKPMYKVGDLVVNNEALIGTWYAMIYKAKHFPNCGSPDGYAYETIGFWGDELKRGRKKRPSLRQLWANHLTLDTNQTVAALRAYL